MIRYIPISVVTPTFKWMANFWSYMQKRVYGDTAYRNSLLAIVKQNRLNDPVYSDVDWNLHGLPHKIVDSVYKYVDSTNPNCIVINVFSALKPLLDTFDDSDTICITDMDVIALRPYAGREPLENEVICYNGYEDWHMFIANRDKKNYSRIQEYLTHDEQGFMNGGFVPILIKLSTLKQIIDDVITISEKIIESDTDQNWRWWSCMTAFSIACHNHKIKMLDEDNTYIPNYNKLDLSKHYFAHYSVDPVFNKHTFPNHDIEQYPNNAFYNFIKEWIIR